MEYENKVQQLIEKNVGSILGTLLVSFVIGTVAMIYNSDKNSQVFETKLTYISQTMLDLKMNISALENRIQNGVKDRWTREDHKDYEVRIEENLRIYRTRIEYKIEKMEDRLLQIETSRSS